MAVLSSAEVVATRTRRGELETRARERQESFARALENEPVDFPELAEQGFRDLDEAQRSYLGAAERGLARELARAEARRGREGWR